VKFYLAHDQERKTSAERSYELVLKKHSTIERARTVIENVFGS